MLGLLAFIFWFAYLFKSLLCVRLHKFGHSLLRLVWRQKLHYARVCCTIWLYSCAARVHAIVRVFRTARVVWLCSPAGFCRGTCGMAAWQVFLLQLFGKLLFYHS